MTPGLTCTRCKGQLYPHTAKHTDDGYTHAHRCPRMCSVEDCDRKHHSRGYCLKHYHRAKDGGDPNRPPATVNTAERLEDVRWMAETGENLDGAAQRLGMTVEALEKWCARHDKEALTTLIAARPRDHNRVIDTRISVSDLTGQKARRERRRQRETEAA